MRSPVWLRSLRRSLVILERARVNEFSTSTTRRTLDLACAKAGLDSADAELVRLGENAIYRLHHHPVVARIARTDAYLPDVQKEVAVARWLATVDVVGYAD